MDNELKQLWRIKDEKFLQDLDNAGKIPVPYALKYSLQNIQQSTNRGKEIIQGARWQTKLIPVSALTCAMLVFFIYSDHRSELIKNKAIVESASQENVELALVLDSDYEDYFEDFLDRDIAELEDLI